MDIVDLTARAGLCTAPGIAIVVKVMLSGLKRSIPGLESYWVSWIAIGLGMATSTLGYFLYHPTILAETLWQGFLGGVVAIGIEKGLDDTVRIWRGWHGEANP